MLQRQVDDLDELKAHHYQEIMEHEEEVWDFVQGKVCFFRKPSRRKFYIDIFRRYALWYGQVWTCLIGLRLKRRPPFFVDRSE